MFYEKFYSSSTKVSSLREDEFLVLYPITSSMKTNPRPQKCNYRPQSVAPVLKSVTPVLKSVTTVLKSAHVKVAQNVLIPV